jgi:hypothetical protein
MYRYHSTSVINLTTGRFIPNMQNRRLNLVDVSIQHNEGHTTAEMAACTLHRLVTGRGANLRTAERLRLETVRQGF